MRKHLNLSQRVKLTFICSFILLSVISMTLVFAAIKNLEDYIFETQLELEIAHYQEALANQQPAFLPKEITNYQSLSDMPDDLAQFITSLSPGTYELNHPSNIDYHYTIMPVKDGKQAIFLYNVSALELSENLEFNTFRFIIIGFIALLLVFFLIFQLILKRSLAPMYRLIDQVKLQTEQPDRAISCDYTDDNEIGLLHKTIASYSQRIEEFIQREREFSSFTSHELRTPVTIIKGATELLSMQESQPEKITKPLGRISRAIHSMETMIEVLLNLSREQQNPSHELRDLEDIFSFILPSFDEQAKSNNQKILVTGTLTQSFKVESIPAEIVIANLLRNAIQHSGRTDITITLSKRTIKVTNELQDNSYKSTQDEQDNELSYGLGKAIIDRICNKYQWQYQETLHDNQYSILVEFG